MTAQACKRGEVWLVNFNPGRGSEQQGIRPAVIIQNDIGNQYSSTTIVAAVTTTIKRFPVTVVLNRREGGLKEVSMVNLAQLLTIDRERLIKRLGSLPSERLIQMDRAIAISLGLSV